MYCIYIYTYIIVYVYVHTTIYAQGTILLKPVN